MLSDRRFLSDHNVLEGNDLKPLPSHWAHRETIDVAIDLLGKILCVQTDPKRMILTKIVETEAYLGAEDPACHTFQGRRTARTEPMFGPPGTSYVYLIYGMYHCLNLVTGNGEAILIRALEPLIGFNDDQLTQRSLSGPGKLCRELGINKAHNSLNMLDPSQVIHLLALKNESLTQVLIGPRIGIEGAGDSAYWPLRFGVKDSKFLSRPFT